MKPEDMMVRSRIVFISFLILAIVIVWRLLDVGLIHKTKFRMVNKEITFAVRNVPAKRGNIYSSDGKLLATSLTFFRLSIDPTIVDKSLFESYVDELSSCLSIIFKNKTKEEHISKIKKARNSGKHYLQLGNRPISFDEKIMLDKTRIVKLGRYKGGIIFTPFDKRFNPFENLGSRVIGYVNDNCGVVGIEKEYDEYLRGQDGKALFQHMAGDFWQITPSQDNYNPVKGCDIITTIDSNIEDIVHDCLKRTLIKTKANYGSAIIMEVKTGDIKALINLSRDKNGKYSELYNYAMGSYGSKEPGSVFKLLSFLALFEETNLQLNDIVDTGNGVYKFANIYMHDTHQFGKITVKESFEHSSNIAVAKLINNAFGNNPNKFLNHIRRLKLDKPLGLLKYGEAVPYVKKYKDRNWTSVTLPWMAMGYEIKLSPIQIITLYNAIANNGVMIKPKLIQSINRGNSFIKNFETEIMCDKICSDATLIKLKKLLKGVIERGTGKRFNDGIYSLSGKSGTVNKLINGKYSNNTTTTFAGYFPSEKPKYSCIIVIDDPKGKKYHFAGQVAGPVLYEIMNKIAVKDREGSETIMINRKCIEE